MLVAGTAGCSSGHRRAAGPPPTTLLSTDRWAAPRVSGVSAANFCTVLTAMYRHAAELPRATAAVKEKILADFVATVPEAEGVAPADISGPAHIYLGSLARFLTELDRAGLDYRKLPAGTLSAFLLDPKVKSAGNAVLAYSQNQCHYSIPSG